MLLAYSQLFGQAVEKQGNTPGAELYADAPYHMQKTDGLGDLNPVPIHVFAHGSAALGSNYELMNIVIKVKNASDNSFETTINFNDYTVEEFNDLFVNKSSYNADLDIQAFDESGAIKSPDYSIDFTSDSHALPPTTYVDITHDYWWFTILIPGEMLDGLNDVIDFEVDFELDWEVDYQTYFRVFRQNSDYPVIDNWYRGDVHYHGMYTQNDSEVGLPLDATKYMGKVCGLDWMTFTDHSCDYDNYGLGTHENWQSLGDEVAALNAEDDSFILIRAIEMTIKNSDNSQIHALTYPDPENPFGFPYVGDGDGDLIETDVTVDMFSDSLTLHNGFAYAAHPFSEGDELSFVIDGDVWNVGSEDFPQNGGEMPGGGGVICNDMSEDSDLFSSESDKLIKNNIVGGEIWNLCNDLMITSNEDNVWDVFNEGDDDFYKLSVTDTEHHLTRFAHNRAVTEFIWKKGLETKNSNPDIQNWKFFMSAGSDAHGSFNYSTTDYFMDVQGQITDNAIGKLSTLAYCPDGMGTNGENVLFALKNGNTIMSSGPIVSLEIDTDHTNDTPEIIVGNDQVIDYSQLSSTSLTLNASNSAEYGIVVSKTVTIQTETYPYTYSFPNSVGEYEVSLEELLIDVFGEGNIPMDEYFLIRAQLETYREYPDVDIYKQNSTTFESYTNPIWLKINSPSSISEASNGYQIYPNPTNEFFFVRLLDNELGSFELVDMSGRPVLQESEFQQKRIDVSNLPSGMYFATIRIGSKSYHEKLILK